MLYNLAWNNGKLVAWQSNKRKSQPAQGSEAAADLLTDSICLEQLYTGQILATPVGHLWLLSYFCLI